MGETKDFVSHITAKYPTYNKPYFHIFEHLFLEKFYGFEIFECEKSKEEREGKKVRNQG